MPAGSAAAGGEGGAEFDDVGEFEGGGEQAAAPGVAGDGAVGCGDGFGDGAGGGGRPGAVTAIRVPGG